MYKNLQEKRFVLNIMSELKEKLIYKFCTQEIKEAFDIAFNILSNTKYETLNKEENERIWL